jgi:hypothetical protein
MVRRYATLGFCIALVASIIAMPAHMQAAQKRHKMSCKQLLFTTLGLAAAAQGMSCAHISGFNPDKGHFVIATQNPLCSDGLVEKGYYQNDYAAGIVDAVAGHTSRSVVRMTGTSCTETASSSKTRTKTTICDDIFHLERSEIVYEQSQAQKTAQLPAPAR